LFALAGIKQKRAEMFQVLSGQLDNTGLEVACKAKNSEKSGLSAVLLWITGGKPLKMGPCRLKSAGRAVFWAVERKPERERGAAYAVPG
jgi:hypothetical protein